MHGKVQKYYLGSNDGFIQREIDLEVQEAEKANGTKSTSQWLHMSDISRVAESGSLRKR